MTYNNYDDFVSTLLSEPSTDIEVLIARMRELNDSGDCAVPQLITAAVGMSAEAGEFLEVVKKVLLQGKPWNDETKFHLKRELSDQMFYIQTACLSLDTSIDDIIDINIQKLKDRYPGGFTVDHSEHRRPGDL